MRSKWEIAFKYRCSIGFFKQQRECPRIKSTDNTIALILNVLACLFVLFVCFFCLFVCFFCFVSFRCRFCFYSSISFVLREGTLLLPERCWQPFALGTVFTILGGSLSWFTHYVPCVHFSNILSAITHT